MADTKKCTPQSCVYLGAETGILKGANPNEKYWQNLTATNEVSKEKQITSLCWGDDSQTEVCFGRMNGDIDTYQVSSQSVVNVYSETSECGALCGLAKWGSCYASCTDKGHVSVYKNGEKEIVCEAGPDVYKMRQSPFSPGLVATGGKENDLKLWNLESPAKPVFMAKNVRHDWLDLRVPVWVCDIGFLSDSEKLVTCTGHHQVRVYDPLTPQRRPVLDIEIEEYPLTCLSVRPGQHQVVVGDTHGLMALVDLRGKGYVVQKYKGFSGAIRSVACHPSRGLVASCGLDRTLRIHDIDSREMTHKLYLKSRLNCLLLSDKWETGSDDKIQSNVKVEVAEPEEGEEAMESLWNDMEVVNTKCSKHTNSKKVKRVETDSDKESDTSSEDERTEEVKPSKRKALQKRKEKPKKQKIRKKGP